MPKNCLLGASNITKNNNKIKYIYIYIYTWWLKNNI